ncbi:hypothetical protein PILCRDRAFT_814563, partial [Piloderma croceum F 1598]
MPWQLLVLNQNKFITTVSKTHRSSCTYVVRGYGSVQNVSCGTLSTSSRHQDSGGSGPFDFKANRRLCSPGRVAIADTWNPPDVEALNHSQYLWITRRRRHLKGIQLISKIPWASNLSDCKMVTARW